MVSLGNEAIRSAFVTRLLPAIGSRVGSLSDF